MTAYMYLLQYNLIVCKNWHLLTYQMSATFSKLSTALLHLLLYQYIVTIFVHRMAGSLSTWLWYDNFRSSTLKEVQNITQTAVTSS